MLCVYNLNPIVPEPLVQTNHRFLVFHQTHRPPMAAPGPLKQIKKGVCAPDEHSSRYPLVN